MPRVWLECHGENPGDRENLGPINYHPGTGFSANFYPYLNQVPPTTHTLSLPPLHSRPPCHSSISGGLPQSHRLRPAGKPQK